MSRKINSKQWLIIMAVVLIFSLLYYFQNKDKQIYSSKLIPSSTHAVDKENKLTEHRVDFTSDDTQPSLVIVKSYQGSQPDGAIHLDTNGNVIVDKDLKRLFDYYLSAIGELPLDQMRKYLQQFAGEQLNSIQLQQLLMYFDQYHNYLNKADIFTQNIDDDLSLLDKMNLLSEFRTDVLGIEMAESFFADEQEYIEFVMTEKNSNEWTQQQQEWLHAENQATKFQDVVLENRVFNNSENIDSVEIYKYRVEKYGQETANRLSQLDQQRAQWQTVVDDYFLQRQQIENQQSSLSIEQLKSNYTTQEIRRLEALWRINHQ